jgi:hypothetical protein
MAVNESSSVGFIKKNYFTMTAPAQSVTKELVVNFISILGFGEQGFWFQQGGGYIACSKSETANVAHILCLSHYFSKCIKKTLYTLEELKRDILLHVSSISEETLQWVA